MRRTSLSGFPDIFFFCTSPYSHSMLVSTITGFTRTQQLDHWQGWSFIPGGFYAQHSYLCCCILTTSVSRVWVGKGKLVRKANFPCKLFMYYICLLLSRPLILEMKNKPKEEYNCWVFLISVLRYFSVLCTISLFPIHVFLFVLPLAKFNCWSESLNVNHTLFGFFRNNLTRHKVWKRAQMFPLCCFDKPFGNFVFKSFYHNNVQTYKQQDSHVQTGCMQYSLQN